MWWLIVVQILILGYLVRYIWARDIVSEKGR